MTTFANLRALAQINAPRVTLERIDLVELLGAYDVLAGASRKKKPTKAAPTVTNLPDWLPLDAWTEFLAMRVKIKKPATEYAQKQLLKQLSAFYAADFDPRVILNNSIMNCWLGLFAPKDQTTAYRGARPAVADQNRQNNQEALRLLDQPNFISSPYPDDGMTLEMK